ncbi:epidermal growth factor receptor substrate 15 isoform X5 [Mucor ambiguus]|uniref:Epidermal growth factor receptor substrate 15 isoform X5 n=1 Tax=Mucor ambiguus TaxID=91626 RepID=A0A0C9M124_9FUNG|nr:epidermal growth factor receptor substrate 15 isoform X5 [Mucor ambiguus]
MASVDWQSQLSVVEKSTYLDLFQKVDADNKGIVLQDEAMEFLKKSDIPQNILSQFWDATDNDKKGFLTEQEFCTIMKLIACAQNGIMTTEPILATKAPLPKFDGPGSANHANSPFQHTQQQSQMPLPQRQASVSNMDVVSPEDRQKYIGLFQSFGPINNILSGERAKDAFIRSNLPPAILQNIWTLADTRKSGTLNQTEFIIAMHYIENAMKGATNLPATLPANVYASATGRSVPASPLVRNNTLQVNSPPPVPMRSPVFKGATTTKVDIAPDEYAKYQTFFRQLDTDNSGHVSGADAVVFFRHSKLPESDLARIWDLADTNLSGHLSEQEFAIAMHMINRRVAGGEIPNSLPAFNSIPDYNPPLQQQQQQQQQQSQQQNVDLLGLSSDLNDTPAPPAPQQPQQPQTPHYMNADLARAQSTLQTDMTTERLRSQTAQSQLHLESQAVQELLRQIEQQKEELAKLRQQADDAEKQLEAEQKRKEELSKDLQMYKQEAKHFNTRIENAKEETTRLQAENAELEKEKQAKSSMQSPTQSAPSTTAAHDFFALSSAPPANSPGGGLFAKVQEPVSSSSFSPVMSHHTGTSVNSQQQQPKFDPFAGFKATQQKNSAPVSPTVSLNKLKQETEQKRSLTPTSNVEISDIESKFPDLTTMEQNFAAPSSPAPPAAPSSPSPAGAARSIGSPSLSTATATSPKPDNSHLYNNLFSKPSVSPSMSKSTPAAKKDPKSKYGFDLSAFEPPSSSSASPFESKASMKDELSSLFGSPSINNAPLPNTASTTTTSQGTGFDDIFGASSSSASNANNTNSFENVFFQK